MFCLCCCQGNQSNITRSDVLWVWISCGSSSGCLRGYQHEGFKYSRDFHHLWFTVQSTKKLKKQMLNQLILSFSWLHSYLVGMAWVRRRQSPTFSVTPLAPLATISGGQKGSGSWATMRSPSSFSHYGNPEKAWQGGLKSWGEVWWRRRHPKTKTPSLLVRCVTVASGCFRDWPFLVVPHPN